MCVCLYDRASVCDRYLNFLFSYAKINQDTANEKEKESEKRTIRNPRKITGNHKRISDPIPFI